jgi:hypothetical protein
MGEEFYRVLPVFPQTARDRTISPSTVAWHKIDPTRKELLGDYLIEGLDGSVTDIMLAVEDLAAFVDDRNVWANSTSFDCKIIRSLAKEFSKKRKMWSFRQERDFRTMKELFAKNFPLTYKAVSGGANSKYTAHHALGDCRYQIEVLQGFVANGMQSIKL